MSEAIVIALITSLASIAAVVVTTMATSRKFVSEMEKNLAIVNLKIEQLTTEVSIHNSFATKIPLLEMRIAQLEKGASRHEN